MSCRDTHCPKCAFKAIAYDVIHAFYRCEVCQHVWVRPEADFDFNEADFLLEQINQIEPEYPSEYVMRGICITDEYPQGYPYDPSEPEEEEFDTIWVVQTGYDTNGMTVMRFESTLPGDAVMPNGFTPNSLFAAMAQGLQKRGIKLIQD